MTAARRVVAGEQVDVLLEAMASGAAEPGAGAFAVVAAASAAALVSAVVQRTVARSPGDASSTARLTEIAEEADAARPALLASADRYAEVAHSLAVAARMPQETEEERTTRLRTLQSVLEEAVDVQLDLARRAVLLAGLAEEATAAADPNAAADGLTAVGASYAAALAALANVELNAFAIVDPVRRAELTETCGALGERATAMLADARAAFDGRIHATDP